MKHFEESIRQSIKKDFDNAFFKQRAGRKQSGYKIIDYILINSEYYKFKKFLVGKTIRIIRNAESGQWIEFVNDSDRIALNKYAGWSEKKQYLINAKYKEL